MDCARAAKHIRALRRLQEGAQPSGRLSAVQFCVVILPFYAFQFWFIQRVCFVSSMSSAVHGLLQRENPDALCVTRDFPIDANVVAKFPQGTKILSADPYGTSAWTITARLLVELPN